MEGRKVLRASLCHAGTDSRPSLCPHAGGEEGDGDEEEWEEKERNK